MIEVQLGQLVASAESIKNILDAKLPIKVAINLARIGKRIQEEIALYEGRKNKLIEDLGEVEYEKDKGGGPVLDAKGNKKLTGRMVVMQENIPDFVAQITAALEASVKIEAEPVSAADFGEKTEVSASDLIACAAFIIE